MSKLMAAHLEPLAKAFDAALKAGDITVEQAYDFCHATYDSYLEQRVINGDAKARHIMEFTSQGNKDRSRKDR